MEMNRGAARRHRSVV